MPLPSRKFVRSERPDPLGVTQVVMESIDRMLDEKYRRGCAST
jgi:hypothetical protein